MIDFISIDDARAKTILYILVGALALAIGCIYMVLESKIGKAAKTAAGVQVTGAFQPQYYQPQYVQPQVSDAQASDAQVSQPGDLQSVADGNVEGNVGNNDTL